jgi:hypothetical protein
MEVGQGPNVGCSAKGKKYGSILRNFFVIVIISESILSQP